MTSRPTALTCPEAYHIAYLHSQGYGCKLISEMTDRNEDWLCRSFRAAKNHTKLAKFVGVLSRGKRPAKELKRYEVAR